MTLFGCVCEILVLGYGSVALLWSSSSNSSSGNDNNGKKKKKKKKKRAMYIQISEDVEILYKT